MPVLGKDNGERDRYGNIERKGDPALGRRRDVRFEEIVDGYDYRYESQPKWKPRDSEWGDDTRDSGRFGNVLQ